MKIIELTQNQKAIVDDEDFKELSQHKWYLHRNGYAARSVILNNKGTTLMMHRVIIDAQKGFQVDHINQEKLDNRKINLRSVNQQRNLWNSPMRKNNTTGYKGVFLDKRSGTFTARIESDGKSNYLGCFKSKEKAALAYNEAAKSMRKGEITYLNPVSS